MSNKDVQERTEPPTPRKLRKLREKGSISKSKDLASAAALTGILTLLCMAWPWYFDQFEEILTSPFTFLGRPFRETVLAVTEAVCNKAIWILGPILLIPVILAVIANLVQFGALFSIHPMLPKMERLNPAEGLKRLFSLRHLVETIKAVIKTLVLGCTLYFLIKDTLQPLIVLPYHGINGVLQMMVRLTQHLFIVSIVVFLAMSLVDILVQKRLFLYENRMSKYDVKRDHKEAEGDPHIKSRRKLLHTLMNAESGRRS